MSHVSTAIGTVEQRTLRNVALGDHFEINEHGLEVKGRPPFDVFEALGETLRTLDRSLQFAIGDFFREVEDRFGEQASQILDHTGWSEETLRNYRWTASKVAPEVRRMDRLTFSHHQAVAKLPPQEQRQWLDRAANPPTDDATTSPTPWPVSRLKAEIRHSGSEAGTVKTYGATVFCDDEADQAALGRQLDNLGRRYKMFVSVSAATPAK